MPNNKVSDTNTYARKSGSRCACLKNTFSTENYLDKISTECAPSPLDLMTA